MRTEVRDRCFDEERALYHLQHADLCGVRFAGPADGESALKEARDVTLRRCAFSLRYPLWHTVDFTMADCTMAETARAAIWYAKNGTLERCVLGGVKAVRECKNIRLLDRNIVSPEFGWKSQNLILERTKITAEYPFFDSSDLRLQNVELHGKYSFQYVSDVEIKNSSLDTKDAFWHSKNVTVRQKATRAFPLQQACSSSKVSW